MRNLDIHTGILTAVFLTLLLGLFSLMLGVRAIRSGSRLTFFRKRRDRMMKLA